MILGIFCLREYRIFNLFRQYGRIFNIFPDISGFLILFLHIPFLRACVFDAFLQDFEILLIFLPGFRDLTPF